MLRAENLHYRAGEREILARVDLTLAAGELVSLIGPNGAGKSTLLKCLNGVLEPSGGAVHVRERAMRTYAARELARTIAYVPQQDASALSLSVVDMVSLGRAPHRGTVSRARDREIVLDVMTHLGLEALALRRFASLSGGERQRVLIARALAQEGQILLLDEPTNALDLRHQLDMMLAVRALVQSRGLTVLMAIHDLSLASRFSDRLILLHAGRVHAEGPWRQVLSGPHIETVYGVGAVIGVDADLPYVIPVPAPASARPTIV